MVSFKEVVHAADPSNHPILFFLTFALIKHIFAIVVY